MEFTHKPLVLSGQESQSFTEATILGDLVVSKISTVISKRYYNARTPARKLMIPEYEGRLHGKGTF